MPPRRYSGVPEYINELEAAASSATVPGTSKVFASSCTQSSGTWADWTTVLPPPGGLPTGTLVNTSMDATLTCSVTVNNGALYMWFTSHSAFPLTSISIDGGAPINNGLGQTVSTRNMIRVTGLTNGVHSVVITAYTQGVGGGPSPNETFIIALGTPPPTNSCCRLLLGGVLRQQNDNNGVVTAAYNAAAYGVFSDMASDGLNVSFVPVRNYVNDTTDMANQLHPNDTGQAHLVQAFEASWSNGTLINGLPLYLWAVASGGGGTSGTAQSSYQKFTTCPIPAGVGGTVAPGGYTGSPQNISGVSAWNAATHVADGGVTWVCLTPVDYNTCTAANADDPVSWSAGLSLGFTQFVVTAAGNAYGCFECTGVCTTGTTAPTGTPMDRFRLMAPAPSLSRQYGLLLQGEYVAAPTYPYNVGGAPAGVAQYTWRSHLKLWWGGAARPEYVNGANGELTQISLGMALLSTVRQWSQVGSARDLWSRQRLKRLRYGAGGPGRTGGRFR